MDNRRRAGKSVPRRRLAGVDWFSFPAQAPRRRCDSSQNGIPRGSDHPVQISEVPKTLVELKVVLLVQGPSLTSSLCTIRISYGTVQDCKPEIRWREEGESLPSSIP